MYKYFENRNNVDSLNNAFKNIKFNIKDKIKFPDYTALLIQGNNKETGKQVRITWFSFIKEDGKYVFADFSTIKKMWERIETPHVKFYYRKGRLWEYPLKKENFKTEAQYNRFLFQGADFKDLQKMENIYVQASHLLGIDKKEKIEYYIVSSYDELRIATDGVKTNAIAVYYLKENRIVSPFTYVPAEIVKALLDELGNPPVFFFEGFSSLIVNKIENKKNTLSEENVKIIIEGSYSLNDTISEKTKFDTGSYEFRVIADSFIQYLIEKYSLDTFKEYFKLANYDNYDEIFQKIYGKSTNELEKEWRSYLMISNVSK
ncbi:MAG: hypothetical protein ABH869_04165 [Candidatus Omnitrophota bacterium]